MSREVFSQIFGEIILWHQSINNNKNRFEYLPIFWVSRSFFLKNFLSLRPFFRQLSFILWGIYLQFVWLNFWECGTFLLVTRTVFVKKRAIFDGWGTLLCLLTFILKTFLQTTLFYILRRIYQWNVKTFNSYSKISLNTKTLRECRYIILEFINNLFGKISGIVVLFCWSPGQFL